MEKKTDSKKCIDFANEKLQLESDLVNKLVRFRQERFLTLDSQEKGTKIKPFNLDLIKSEEADIYDIERNLTVKNKILQNENQLYKIKVDELESQIQLIYKQKINDYSDINEHLKNTIQQKDEKINELTVQLNKYQAEVKDIISKNKESNVRIEELKNEVQNGILLGEEKDKQYLTLEDKHRKTVKALNETDKRMKYWKHRYEVLEKSKLGRFTLKFWKVRDSLKSKFKGVRK